MEDIDPSNHKDHFSMICAFTGEIRLTRRLYNCTILSANCIQLSTWNPQLFLRTAVLPFKLPTPQEFASILGRSKHETGFLVQ